MNSSFWIAIFSAASYGVWAFAMKKISESPWSNQWTIGITMLIAGVFSMFFAYFQGGFPKVHLSGQYYIWIALTAIMGLVGNILLVKAYQTGGLSISAIAAIISCSSLVTLLAAWLFMGETVNMKNLLGMALIVIGVTLL